MYGNFSIMMSEVTERGFLTLETGTNRKGHPVYRVMLFDGQHWSGGRYRTFDAAHTTYKFMRSVI